MEGELKLVTPLQGEYPKMLRNIQDPPEILYYIGDLSLASRLCVAVVGARKCTEYGRWVAMTIGGCFGENDVVVVSGMAVGIDTHGHKGALSAGGKTIAVMGCGLDQCYPSQNKKLMEKIAEEGLLLSEYPPGHPPTKYTFPARNRIISGLSKATIVVEAGLSSGSLITAECAADQGREVYAVPGNINSLFSMGTNQLLRDGATPLIGAENLLWDLGIGKKTKKSTEMQLGADERKIMEIVRKYGNITVDCLCENTEIEVGKICGIITVLEMKGMIYTALGKIFIAK